MSAKSVTITVDADTASAIRKLEDFFKNATAGFENIAAIGPMLSRIGPALAGVFSVASVVSFTREAINAGEALHNLNKETGMTLRLLSSIKEEAEEAGKEFAVVGQALGQFSNSLGTAIRQGGNAANAFRDLIGTEGLRGFAQNATDVDQVLLQVIEKFNAMPEGPKKTALAMDVFGRSGREVIAMLSAMKGAMKEGSITPEFAKEATKFNQTLRSIRNDLDEIWINLAQRLMPTLQEFADMFKRISLGGSDSLSAISQFISVAVMELGKGLVTVFITLSEKLGEVFVMFAAWSGRMLAESLTSAINKVIEWINGSEILGRLFGKSIQPIKLSATSEEAEQKFLSEVREGAAILKKSVGDFFDNGVKAANDLWGKPKETATPPSGAPAGDNNTSKAPPPNGAPELSQAAQDLLRDIHKSYEEAVKGRVALLEEEQRAQLAAIEREVFDKEKAEQAKFEVVATYARKINAVLEEEGEKAKQAHQAQVEARRKVEDAEHALAMSRIQARRQLLNQDNSQSEADKKAELLELLGEENALLERNIALNRKRAQDAESSSDALIEAEQALQQLQHHRALNELAVKETEERGTFKGEFSDALVQIGDAWGSWAQQAAQTFESVFTGAISTISNGITSLIMGTQSWAQALMNIGTTILTSIIQGIIQMGVRWVLTQTLMAVAGKAMAAAAVAATVPMALAQSAIWATPATLATIASYGGAAAAAPAAIAMSQGLVMAQSLAAFREGGFTGSGGRDQVAGVVHAGEFVFSAPAVSAIGTGRLESMHQGALQGGTGQRDTAKPQRLAVVVSDERRAQDLEGDPYFETVVMNVFDRNRFRYRI
ncbi:MAG TPA: hypothetical protein VN673_12805 [Clostridia bacterium]|nr:hypothetical protein [Clostridia bacterium]